MELPPFIWFVIGLMGTLGVVLGWASWYTRDR